MNTLNELKRSLLEGKLDKKLSQMYCRKGEELIPYRNRMIGVVNGYSEQFGKDGYSEIFGMADNTPAAIFSAPGRTELGGNHTDHQHGKVLTASVDLDAVACAAPNGTDIINVFSEGYGMISVDLNQKQPNPSEYNTSQALIRGVACETARLGYEVSGFDAYVISDVPGGSGLSSSACFEVLMGVIINDFFCLGRLTPIDIAKIGQRAENIYFGKPSGLLDQMGCSLGGTTAIDFASGELNTVDFSFTDAGYAMVMVDSGADHSDLTDEYSAITKDLQAVCQLFGKKVLREVDEQQFLSHFSEIRQKAGDRAALRALHVYEENHRVDAEVRSLQNGNINEFLSLVKSSGISSWTLLQNVTPSGQNASQPVAVALAVTEMVLNGKGVCRIHGGGFAGAIQAFVPIEFLTSFTQGVENILGKGVCRVTYIRPVGGTIITV